PGDSAASRRPVLRAWRRADRARDVREWRCAGRPAVVRSSGQAPTCRDRPRRGGEGGAMITGISAVTLATHDMRRAVVFYRLVELPLVHGGEDASFTSFRAGDNF